MRHAGMRAATRPRGGASGRGHRKQPESAATDDSAALQRWLGLVGGRWCSWRTRPPPNRRACCSESAYGGPVDDQDRELTVRVRVDSDDERAALEQALLRARATELAEVRRNQVRLSAGYGDATTRDSMTGEAARAQLRWMMLDRLLAALRD